MPSKEEYQKCREFVIAQAWLDEEDAEPGPHSETLADGTEIQAMRTKTGVAWSAMKDGGVLESGLQEKNWLETDFAGNQEKERGDK